MKYYVAVTDKSWFLHLASKEPGEVNFWRPTAHSSFRAVPPGSPFLFKLHSPDDFIVGGGFFIKYEPLPLSLAWQAFGENNGAPDVEALLAAVSRYGGEGGPNPTIGCIVLTHPFFLPTKNWIRVPPDWSSNIVRGKTYDTQTATGATLWARVSDLLLAQSSPLGEDLLKGAAMSADARFGSLCLRRVRLGQGAFRVLVTSAYERCCAVSGETVLPVLEAAHIKPHSETGPNLVTNGLLLRSDIHTLFDSGYLTVTPELSVEVSKAVREEFDNGRQYYSYHGQRLTQRPRKALDRPAREYLEWHNENVYLS